MNDTTAKPPLFFQSVVPFDSIAHKNFSVPAQMPDYFFAANTDIIPLVSAEVTEALRNFALVFIKDPSSPAPTLAAVVGTGEGKNLFVDAQGQWRAGCYVPAWVRRYPFMLAHHESEPQKSILAFDPQASMFSAAGDKLQLIEADGKPSATLQKIMEFQKEYTGFSQATTQMAQALYDAQVLEEGTLTISPRADGQDRHVKGFLIVNESKLRELPPAQIETLNKTGALGLAYAQLFSMNSLRQLQSTAP